MRPLSHADSLLLSKGFECHLYFFFPYFRDSLLCAFGNTQPLVSQFFPLINEQNNSWGFFLPVQGTDLIHHQLTQ